MFVSDNRSEAREPGDVPNGRGQTSAPPSGWGGARRGGSGPALQQRIREVGLQATNGIGIVLGRLFGSRAGDSAGILTYHRVTPWKDAHASLPAPTWNVTPERLRQQLAGLLDRGYRPVSLRHLLGGQVRPRSFAVTFDDGYEGVFRHAWPVLRELKVPATVFLATAYLDSDRALPFDDWELAGSPAVEPAAWRSLRTVQCEEMLGGGLIELGSHTHTHRVFRDQPESLGEDVAISLALLRDRFGLQAITFAFPYGLASDQLIEAVRAAGVVCALHTSPELVRPGSDPFTWGRFDVTQRDGPGVIATRLDGWYGAARAVWRRLTGKVGRGGLYE